MDGLIKYWFCVRRTEEEKKEWIQVKLLKFVLCLSLLWIKPRTWGLLSKGLAASYNHQLLCFGDRFC